LRGLSTFFLFSFFIDSLPWQAMNLYFAWVGVISCLWVGRMGGMGI
jgi:hypothetical protein